MKSKKWVFLSFEQIKNRKVQVGIALALAALLVCGIMFSWSVGLLFALLFWGISVIKVEARTDQVAIFLNVLWGLACIAVVVSISPLGGVTNVGILKIMLNFLCAFFVTEIIFAMTGKWRTSINISFCVLALLTTANTVIYQFRGKELGPMDILSINTALNVAEQYSLQISNRLVFFWILCGVCIFSQFSISKFPNLKIRKIYLKIIALPAMLATALLIFWGTADIPIRTWDIEGSSMNGYYLNFYLGIRNAYIKEPDNYSNETIEDYSSLYSAELDEENQNSKPNIIVIMDESYADFNIFEKELSTNIEVTPFIDSLSENTIRGYALSSVYGGNTANSEFEFLTSHSMAFFPENVVPYQQYISKETYSIAQLLNSYGYTSLATHPYFANGWSRDKVFPFLGFDKSTFLDDYPCERLIRNYVSDKEMFSYILEQLESKVDEKPLFMFGITIQNHGGYNYEGDNYSQTIFLEGFEQEYPLAEQYLSLIHETDNAVEYLLTSLKEYSEDTIVLFFGDHFPKVETEFYEELNGGAFNTLDEQMLQYTIPFFIWANYDIHSQYVECTSINYIARYLLENANLELSPYYYALADIEEAIPAINASGYFSLKEGHFISLDDATEQEAEMIEMYEMIQYNNLFDTKNRNENFFGF